jgi:hypothetical protein
MLRKGDILHTDHKILCVTLKRGGAAFVVALSTQTTLLGPLCALQYCSSFSRASHTDRAKTIRTEALSMSISSTHAQTSVMLPAKPGTGRHLPGGDSGLSELPSVIHRQGQPCPFRCFLCMALYIRYSENVFILHVRLPTPINGRFIGSN